MSRHARGSISKKQAIILQALCHLTDKQRKAVLNSADVKLIRCICECAFNLLQGNVPLNTLQKNSLRKHAPVLRKLVAKNSTWRGRKKIIVQRGGFLPLLLAPIIGTVLASLIERVV